MARSYYEYSTRFAVSVIAFIASSGLALTWFIVGTLYPDTQFGIHLYEVPVFWIVGGTLIVAIVGSGVSGLAFSYKMAMTPDETLRLRKSDER